MKRYPATSRAEYEATQRARTAAKWTLNGITREAVEWVYAGAPIWTLGGPILCLGVRNGLEVDLFREVFGCEVQGVELHPQGQRPDVWVGSFDAMPRAWGGRFPILYSNALDHAFDPVATAAEWCRVAQPGAALAVTLDPTLEPTATDPIAQITDADLAEWFGGALSRQAMVGGQRRLLWRLP